ncbi:MAG: betaine--homocysteine S-methyltransferase [Candidatus Promineifilaceae bacterium]|nr:betaine--homocysteine S-methyltransferase [Candidatus Promineifilaceae bacterium]
MNVFLDLLQSEEYLMLDGAMGTLLMAAGLVQGAPPEKWNVVHPDRIRGVHDAYIEAGSRVILTNTFGGTRYRLKLHDLQDRVVELNRAAAETARAAADAAGHPVAVAGSMGPMGELMAPMGAASFEDAKAAFAEQATGLVAGGVDVLWVETMSDVQEVQAAVAGARSVSDLPVVATMSFDTHGRTMMGVTPAEAAKALCRLEVAAMGANCGNNLPDTEAAVSAMYQAAPDRPIVAKANAGIPHWEGDELVYDGTPEVMAGYARRVRQYGARLIGSCCGSGPEHVRAMAEALAGWTPEEATVAPPSAATGERDEPERRGRRRRRRSRTRE